jgi:hypothetical protein
MQTCQRDALRLFPGNAAIQQSEHNVIQDGRHEKLIIGILENQSNLAARYGTGGRPQQTRETQDEGCFPRSVRPKERDRLTLT